MIEITHNGQTVIIGQRITVLSALQLLRVAGIDPDYIRRVMQHELPIDGVETVTIDKAIEVLR